MANRKKQIKRERKQLKALELELQRQKEHKKAGVRRMIDRLLYATSTRHLDGLQNTGQMKKLFCKKRELKKMYFNNYEIFLHLLKHKNLSFSSLDYYEKLLLCFCETDIVNSIDGWEVPETSDENVLFGKLFMHLFVRYDIPKCVERDIYALGQKMNNVNTKLLFHIISGKGLHYFNGNIWIDRKANFYFNQAPEMLGIMRSIYWAKVRAIGYSETMANRLVVDFKMSKTQIENICSDEFFTFLNRIPNIAERELRDVLEFLNTQKGEGYKAFTAYGIPIHIEPLFPCFSLKGRTLSSVKKYIEEWNKHVCLKKELQKLEDLKVSKIKPFRKFEFRKCITIEQVLTTDKLVQEGVEMKHCVGTYARMCWQGVVSIWSMSIFHDDGEVKKILTIEVKESSSRIGQVSGKRNRPPELIECKIIQEWAQQENLIYNFKK